MSSPIKVNYKVYQGSTFKEMFRWESSTKVYVPITAIPKAAPTVLTAENHGLKAGWRFRVTNVSGMKEVNSTSENYYIASEVTEDTVTINGLNSLGFGNYTTGGVVEYNQPVDITGYSAKMQIRERIDSDTAIDTLTTENGGIVIDATNHTITINIPASRTAEYSFKTAVYSLELSRNGEVYPFLSGTLTLNKEVTR